MRNILPLLSLAFVLIQTITGVADVLTTGLVAYFPFNGNANDESGNGHNASTSGATLVAGVDGKANSAYSMANVDTQRIVANGIDLANSSLSVSFWYKKNTPIGTQRDVAGLRIGNESNAGKEMQIFLDYGVPIRFDFFFNQLDVQAPGEIQKWQHLVCSYDKDSFRRKVYLNGNLVGSNVASYGFSGSGYFDISAHNDTSFDEVRIYNRVLSEAEVKLLYDFPIPVPSLHRAKATPQIVNGFLVGATITDGGYGYNDPPIILIDGEGKGAILQAEIINQVVSAIKILNPGHDYNSGTTIQIASPPFTPSLAIEVSKVNVKLSVTLGRKYQLESTKDLQTWTSVGVSFVANDEVLIQEFSVIETGQIFRIHEVQ